MSPSGVANTRPADVDGLKCLIGCQEATSSNFYRFKIEPTSTRKITNYYVDF